MGRVVDKSVKLIKGSGILNISKKDINEGIITGRENELQRCKIAGKRGSLRKEGYEILRCLTVKLLAEMHMKREKNVCSI